MNEWLPTCQKTRRTKRDSPAITRIGATGEGTAFVEMEVPGSRLLPDGLFPTLLAALSLMDFVVNNVPSDYSTWYRGSHSQGIA